MTHDIDTWLSDVVGQRLVISVPEAGALLGLGRGASYAAAKGGAIPTLRLGRRVVVPVPRLLELVGAVSHPEHTNGEPATGSPLANVHALDQEDSGGLHGAPRAS